MKKLTFEIRSPAHQQNAIHAVQQILPDPTKPIVVTIQERNRSLDQNRKLWACLGDVSRQVEWHGRWLDAESWKCVFVNFVLVRTELFCHNDSCGLIQSFYIRPRRIRRSSGLFLLSDNWQAA
jgi:hypothetical protein